MTTTRQAAGIVLVSLVCASGWADEGNIPIYQATVITEPGGYVLTRDINVSAGDAILIQASNVTLDLKGHTIRNMGITNPDHPIRIADGSDKIRIVNGRISGGWEAVVYGTGGLSPDIGLVLEGLEISDTVQDGVDITNARYLEVLSCKFKNIGNNAISFGSGNGGLVSGTIVGNEIVDPGNRGIVIGPHRNVVVSHNVVSRVKGAGLNLSLGYGDLVEGNVFSADPAAVSPTVGLILVIESSLVQNNVLRGFSTGISVFSGLGTVSNANRITGNVVTHGIVLGAGLGDAISIDTARNLIEGNLLEENAGCGIRLSAASAGNAYRNNILRGNTAGTVCNTGAGNTDAGGNL